jgi:hypothetical protein
MVAATEHDEHAPTLLMRVWSTVRNVGSGLAVTAALANLGDRLVDGVGLLVLLVDFYRFAVDGIQSAFFSGFRVSDAYRPPSEVIDLFVVILFTRNIILSYFLRDLLRANGAPRRGAVSDPKFRGIIIDNYLARVWFPIVLTAFYWVQSFLITAVFDIAATPLRVLLVWGIVGFVRGMLTGYFGTLPRWFIYPYVTYRVKYTGLQAVPSMFGRYYFWLWLLLLPLIFELNQNADVFLPWFQDRLNEASEAIRGLRERTQ